MNYLIVTALKDEAIGLEAFAPVVHTGVGKVNACIGLYAAILKYKPELVLNYGTAGSISGRVGLHKVGHFVQVDMDARALDFPRGITPFSNEQLPDRPGIVLGTGDRFITDAQQQLEGLGVAIDLVDMEGYALGKVCEHLQVQFMAYKFVSDNADDSASADWQDSVKSGTRLFMALLNRDFGTSTLI